MLSGKPCSCGGNNENCYRCSGTGVYNTSSEPSSEGVPVYTSHNQPDQSKWSRKSKKNYKIKTITKIEKPPNPASSGAEFPMTTCSECGCAVSVRKLASHIKKVHKSVTPLKPTPQPNVNYKVGVNVDVRFMVSKKKKLVCSLCGKISSNLEDDNYHWLTHSQERLTREDRDYASLNQSSETISTQVVQRTALANKLQLKGQSKKSRIVSLSVKPILPPQNFIPHKWSESRLDGSRNYYNHYREDHNQLGSHPCHDDYGDESSA